MRFDPSVEYVWNIDDIKYGKTVHEMWEGTTAKFVRMHPEGYVEMEYTRPGKPTTVGTFHKSSWIPSELEVDPLKELFVDAIRSIR